MANQQGWNQQTPAVQSMLGGAIKLQKIRVRPPSIAGANRALGTAKSRKKKRAAEKRAAARSAKRSASSSGSGKKRTSRLVKGSAAAKAFMAKIRPKR